MGMIQRSFYGGILIIVILLFRALLLNKLPKRTFPVLWSLVLARLLVPFSFSSVFSIYSLLEQQTENISSPLDHYGMAMGTGIAASPVQSASHGLSAEAGVLSLSVEKAFPVLSVVWCVGLLLCGAFFAGAYLYSVRQFRRAAIVENNWIHHWQRRHKVHPFISVRQSELISAPLTYGIIRPVILLPKQLIWEDRRELEYVLQHEYMHICHCDAVLKLLMVTALCLHWFNPLVWVMMKFLNKDIELACDESVLRRFGERARSGYAMALIDMEEKKLRPVPFYNGFSKNAIEERIKSIMKYKKLTYAAAFSASLLVVLVALCFATSASQAQAAPAPVPVPISTADTDPDGTPLDPPGDGRVPEPENQNLPDAGSESAPLPSPDETPENNLPSETGQSQPENLDAIRETATAFWEAYLTQDRESLTQYLSDSYSGEPEFFPDGQDGHVAAEVNLLNVKGLEPVRFSPDGTLGIWLEFRPAAGADYLEYLALTAVRKADGWKVLSYGLEM